MLYFFKKHVTSFPDISLHVAEHRVCQKTVSCAYLKIIHRFHYTLWLKPGRVESGGFKTDT